MRIVLDANVLLAGFGTHGLCEALVARCLEVHDFVLSQHLLDETSRYLKTKIKVPARQAATILAFLRDHADVVQPAMIDTIACRDPNDLPVLGTAVAGHADLLITGEQNLLVLGEFAGIPILTPRAGYERLR